MYMCDPPRIDPSLPEYTPFLTTKCDLPRIYPPSQNLPPPFNNYNNMQRSQNVPLPPRIYPHFFQQLYMTLQKSTIPSQNIPPFSTIILFCDAPIFYNPATCTKQSPTRQFGPTLSLTQG